MPELANTSVIGRLLEEVSWEGASVRSYRFGGRGHENVLTAEVFQLLDFLPRKEFLGELFRRSEGAEVARLTSAAEIAEAVVTMLPDETKLSSRLPVQPDATIASTRSYTLIEAKRIRPSSFQPEQLAREYLAVLRSAGQRIPLLLLVLAKEPPVVVKGVGLLSIEEAVALHLSAVLQRVGTPSETAAELLPRVPEVVAWVTWDNIQRIALEQTALFSGDGGAETTVRRMAAALARTIDWHRDEKSDNAQGVR